MQARMITRWAMEENQRVLKGHRRRSSHWFVFKKHWQQQWQFTRKVMHQSKKKILITQRKKWYGNQEKRARTHLSRHNQSVRIFSIMKRLLKVIVFCMLQSGEWAAAINCIRITPKLQPAYSYDFILNLQFRSEINCVLRDKIRLR